MATRDTTDARRGATGILPVRSAARDCSPAELASGLDVKAEHPRFARRKQSVPTTVN